MPTLALKLRHVRDSRRRVVPWALLATLLLPAGFTVRGADSVSHWPQFRGPGALGVSENPNLPERWGTNENVAWKVEVPGRGWSSPIVWGRRVFLTTVVSEGEVEDPKKGLYFGGERKEPAKGTHHWRVLCFDLGSGRELWRQEAHAGPAVNRLHVKDRKSVV